MDRLHYSAGFVPQNRHPVSAETSTQNQTLKCVDLGSGAGLPGLVLAFQEKLNAGEMRGNLWTLCDRSQKAADFLKWAAAALELQIAIVKKSAEKLENRYDIITAKAFAAPPLLAECAANLLNVGGKAIVSVSPNRDFKNIWDTDKLGELGFEVNFEREPHSFAILYKVKTTDRKKTRSWKQMKEKPLW